MEKTNVVFLEGERVYLRPLDEETDLATCQRWINSPEIRPFIGSGDFPITRVGEKKFFEDANEASKSPKNVVLAIVRKDGNEFIGTIGLHDLDWVNRSAVTGTLIGDPTNRGQGFGTEAKMLLLEYAFNTLNLNRIGSAALDSNGRSLRYSEKCDYQVEGRTRQAIFKNGRYHDLIQLGILKNDWDKRRQKTQTKKRSP